MNVGIDGENDSNTITEKRKDDWGRGESKV